MIRQYRGVPRHRSCRDRPSPERQRRRFTRRRDHHADGLVQNCQVYGSGGSGLVVSGVAIVSRSRFSSNAGSGIDLLGPRSIVEESAADGNGSGIFMRGGYAHVRDSSISENLDFGIRTLGPANIVSGCNVHANGGRGIHVSSRDNRIEGNHVTRNIGTGIEIDILGDRAVVVRNTLAINAPNVLNTSRASLVPVETETGTDPWANLTLF
ncbi:MAG: right-handed parallel beta-helix repeat-containing protein [Acidobacteria bacterium]|nr:right-handed parallel beta-helix repeat-containing protein [Acidobacteriota bacterium]